MRLYIDYIYLFNLILFHCLVKFFVLFKLRQIIYETSEKMDNEFFNNFLPYSKALLTIKMAKILV